MATYLALVLLQSPAMAAQEDHETPPFDGRDRSRCRQGVLAGSLWVEARSRYRGQPQHRHQDFLQEKEEVKFRLLSHACCPTRTTFVLPR